MNAIDSTFDGFLEFDLVATKDGLPLLHHDAYVEGLDNKKFKIADFEMATLREERPDFILQRDLTAFLESTRRLQQLRGLMVDIKDLALLESQSGVIDAIDRATQDLPRIDFNIFITWNWAVLQRLERVCNEMPVKSFPALGFYPAPFLEPFARHLNTLASPLEQRLGGKVMAFSVKEPQTEEQARSGLFTVCLSPIDQVAARVGPKTLLCIPGKRLPSAGKTKDLRSWRCLDERESPLIVASAKTLEESHDDWIRSGLSAGTHNPIGIVDYL